jgi:energy-coupling factor transport system ATP-binding protein
VVPLVQVAGVKWRYAIGDWVLRDVGLEIRAGERVGLVGRSGSGKSSLALTLNGIIPQSYAGQMAGTITVVGQSAATTPVAEMARTVAMVFQSPDDQMTQILVRHEVGSGPANLGLALDEVHRRTAAAVEQLEIGPLADRETTTLSGGEKQKVALAAALAMRPRLLVLDEPTTDLDPRAKAELVRTLRDLDGELAIVIVSHDIETIAPLVDRLVILDGGAVVEDASAGDVFERPAVLAAHGVPAPQLAMFTTLLRERLPEWSAASDIDAVVSGLQRLGVGSTTALADSTCEPRSAGVAVRLEEVSFRYPHAESPALSDVSLSIGRGELLAIVGNNGSGKTTLSKLVLGLLQPTRGTVWIDEARVERIRPDVVGYIYQNPDAMLSQMSVREEVAFTPMLLGRADWRDVTDDMLDRFGLGELQQRFPLALSKGQRQRLAYAAITAARPPVLIFDEPTTGIDLPGCDQIMAYMDELRRQGKTIIFITHDMPLALHWADRVVVMHAGRVAHVGSPASMLELGSRRLAECGLTLPPLYEVMHRLGLRGGIRTPEALVSALYDSVAACGA